MIFHTFPFTLSHFYPSTLSLSQVFSAYWWPTKHHAATHFFKLYFFIIFISYYYISTKQHAAKLFLNGYLLYRLCLADLNKVREFHPFDQVHILSSIGCINFFRFLWTEKQNPQTLSFFGCMFHPFDQVHIFGRVYQCLKFKTLPSECFANRPVWHGEHFCQGKWKWRQVYLNTCRKN